MVAKNYCYYLVIMDFGEDSTGGRKARMWGDKMRAD